MASVKDPDPGVLQKFGRLQARFLEASAGLPLRASLSGGGFP